MMAWARFSETMVFGVVGSIPYVVADDVGQSRLICGIGRRGSS